MKNLSYINNKISNDNLIENISKKVLIKLNNSCYENQFKNIQLDTSNENIYTTWTGPANVYKQIEDLSCYYLYIGKINTDYYFLNYLSTDLFIFKNSKYTNIKIVADKIEHYLTCTYTYFKNTITDGNTTLCLIYNDQNNLFTKNNYNKCFKK